MIADETRKTAWSAHSAEQAQPVGWRLTAEERESIALMLADALMPYGRDFNPEDAARLIEGRLSALLAKREERGRAATSRFPVPAGAHAERECQEAEAQVARVRALMVTHRAKDGRVPVCQLETALDGAR